MRNGNEAWRRLDQRDLARRTANYRQRFETSFSADVSHPLWRRVVASLMVVVTYFAPVVAQLDGAAHATPIVDPHAPVVFQPTVTQSSGGTPVINITAPNASGMSVSQFQNLSVGSEGLIFNNSLVGGTSLIGGQVGANANLVAAGRTASTILAQVTSTGSQYASVIAGPLEIFGNTATLVIANPNGISLPNGTALTNISNLTLTTGTPQFITAGGGAATDYAHAGALAYSVSSGNISVNGPPGNDGVPGAGIAGTVGNLDLIAQSVNLGAPLNANERANIVTGNQLVTPTSSDATGITYSQSSNGTANTAAATGLPAGSYAINANQFGSVTAGTILLVGTTAGLGVNMQGPLMATVGNVQVNANGDVTVANTYANQNVSITSAGSTNLSGTGLANQNFTVNSNGDITSTGTLSAGGNAALTAGGNLNANSVAANGNTTLNAANAMTVGSVSGQNLSLQTATGDLTVNSAVTAPGTISASAGRDLSVNGSVQGGRTVDLTASRNAAVNGAVSGVGNTTIAAQSGTANVSGNVQTNGALAVSSSQGTTLGGTAQAQGAVSISSQSGSVTGGGKVSSSQGAVSLDAGQNIGLTGAIQAGTTVAAQATGDTSLAGTVSAPGAISVGAGGNATLGGNATSGGTLTVTAGGNAAINGAAASVGDMKLTAGTGSLSTTGSVTTLGSLTASGQQGVSLGGNVSSQGNAQLSSTSGNVGVSGTLTTPGKVSVNAGQDATFSGNVHSGGSTTVTAARDAALDGGLEVDGTGNATVNAGRDITGTGSMNVANDTSLSAGRNIGITGAIQTGNNLAATAGTNLSVGATTAVGSERLTATNGSATLGNALSGGNLAVTAGTGIAAQGTVQSLGDLNLNAKGGDLVASNTVSTAGNATLKASGNLNLDAQTTVSKDATLTATNITTQGIAVGGNLTATASGNLDTSAGQLNAAYSSGAPQLSVSGNAQLSGANVTTANAVIGGTYSATGTTSLTTGGTAAYMGNATLAGGAVTNVGTQMAAGSLTVTGTGITNQGALSSLTTMSVSGSSLNNSGTIYGPTATFTVSGATTNSGGLLATNSLGLTTGSLNNTNGLVYAGDVNNPTSPVGNTSVTVNGGNGSFTNMNGQILGQNSVTLALPNQTIDPSASSFGTVNGGNAYTLSALGISNTGTWTLPSTTVNISTTQGLSNSGTITQDPSSLTLSGPVSNSGTITAQDLTINGTLANLAGGTVQANDVFTLNGSGTNAGTVEAINTLNISGKDYDNSNGTTRAGSSASAAGKGNLNVNLSGTLTNASGSLTATNNASIAATTINNSATTTSATTTTTTTVVNSPLLMSTVIGTETVYGITDIGPDGGYLTLVQTTVPATLGGVLSTTGIVPPFGSGWTDGANYNNIGAGYVGVTGPQAAPVATSGTVQYVQVPTVVGYDGNSGTAQTANLWYVQDGSVSGATATRTLTIPGVTETTTTMQVNAGSSVIAAGNNLGITANALNNQGGTVSAGNDATLNVQSLSNGGTSFTSTVTDSVNSASLTAFMNQLQSMQQSGGVSVAGSGNAGGAYGCTNGGGDNGQFCAVGPSTPPTSFTFDSPGAVTVQSVSSSVTVQGATGQITAGHNVNLSGGNLTNAGSIAAGNNVNITASSFTNQGINSGTMTTTAGCASGYSGCTSGATTNPNSQTYSYTQSNANVAAGNDLVIAANTVSNTYGNLAAGRNVVIGGAGTTASDSSTTPTNLTQAASVTNTSGTIAAHNDADISAATLTNTIAAPAQIHQNYGSATPYTGCSSNCEAYVDVQSASPATITANHNVNLSAGSFSNAGSLVTALNNVTINASASASSSNQSLNAYWHANLTHYDASFPAWGCAGNASLCSTLYGSAYQSAQAQDPAGLPDAVGLPDFVPGTIQAGNTLAVNSPTLTNSGNVIGQTVNLTGSTLVNGLTNPNVYTPPPAVSGQVITLGPPSVPSGATTTINSAGLVTTLSGQPTSVTGAAGLPSNSPIGVTTVGKPSAPLVSSASSPQGTTVTTVGGQTLNVAYLVNSPASAVSGDLSPAALLAQLPSSLQPNTTQFYYDPYAQAQQVEQAALQATGQSSFYALPSQTDSANQTTVNNLDTAALYGAALQYAEQNNVALGTQLSQQQLALVNAPMLWYVQETVPEPGCTATGNGACPTVQALMPEVLLPQNFAQVNADGTITGTNVALNYANSILNTGSISASQTLSVTTGTLTNEQRSTNVGTIYQEVSSGVAATTGTEVQQGGFMSAANFQLNADAINAIGGALEVTNADGSENTAATQAMLANLKNQLGNQFTQSTVSNDLATSMAYTDGGMGFLSIIGMVAAAVISIYAGPEVLAAYESAFAAGAAAIGVTSAAALSVGSAVAAGLAVGTTAFAANVADQFIGTGSVNWNNAFETAAVSGLTMGLTQGLLGSTGVTNLGNGVTQGASSITLANLPQTALNIGEQSLIGAGVQTAIEGGSFGKALIANVANDAAAVGANAIGADSNIAEGSLESVALHAAVGCADSAAQGEGCGAGAVGAAASAFLAPTIRDALYNGTQEVSYTDNGDGTVSQSTSYTNAAYNAATTAAAMLVGSGAAALLGLNSGAAAMTAQNEALNNSLSSKYKYLTAQASACSGQPVSCYQQLLTATQTAYQQAQQDVATNCGSGGNASACQTARSDMAQLYVNGHSLQQFVQNTPNCSSVTCVALTTAGTDLAGVGVGAIVGKITSALQSAFSGGATTAASSSTSSLVSTGGDSDLPGVYGNQIQAVAANSVATPYGPALQSNSPAALNAINQVQQGATLFRIGTLGQSQAAEAQFWSLQNPLTTPNYPGLYGIPPENVTNANFVETAVLKPGTQFITRPAPPVGTNPGGGIEVVVPTGGIQMKSFGTQGSH